VAELKEQLASASLAVAVAPESSEVPAEFGSEFPHDQGTAANRAQHTVVTSETVCSTAAVSCETICSTRTVCGPEQEHDEVQAMKAQYEEQIEGLQAMMTRALEKQHERMQLERTKELEDVVTDCEELEAEVSQLKEQLASAGSSGDQAQKYRLSLKQRRQL